MAKKPTYEELEKRIKELEDEVTKRERAEEALRESEERYRELVKHAPAGIFEIDYINQKFVSVNNAMCEISGYTREEFLSINPFDILTEDSKIHFSERMARLFAGEKVPDTPEFKTRAKNGREVWVILNTRFVYKNGKPVGATAIVHDITEIKCAEEALRESEEKYRLLVDNANDGIFIAQDGVIKFPNPKTQEILGYSADELAKLPYETLFHPEDWHIYVERKEKRLKGEEVPSTYSVRVITRAGEVLWAQFSDVPIVWEGEAAKLFFARDITPQKKLEAQLLQAQKMEAIGTLAGGIAHDFNNLLMGIQGNASLILIDIESGHTHYEKLKKIEHQVQSGAELTKQLLGFARGGKYEVKPTDLNTLIKKENQMFGRTKKEITIHEKYEENLWTVEVDKVQIQQILLNLYVNAWQAMPGGGGIFIETENTTLDKEYVQSFHLPPGRFVKLSITDTGIGMDEATQQRIFEPFFTTKKIGRGTGLGLASVYGIVRNHGGIIEVYSKKGKGTTFYIYLPASEKEIIEEMQLPEEFIKGSGTILLVDDEDRIIDVCSELLKTMGYDVLIAKSGKEAIETYRIKKEDVDMVILDMIMPDMSGGETYEKLLGTNSKIKVLLSSGYSIDGQAAEILERGCDGFIQKPFNMKELSLKIKDILSDKKY
jgi:PAS domain S-box-containing protein